MLLVGTLICLTWSLAIMQSIRSQDRHLSPVFPAVVCFPARRSCTPPCARWAQSITTRSIFHASRDQTLPAIPIEKDSWSPPDHPRLRLPLVVRWGIDEPIRIAIRLPYPSRRNRIHPMTSLLSSGIVAGPLLVVIRIPGHRRGRIAIGPGRVQPSESRTSSDRRWTS